VVAIAVRAAQVQSSVIRALKPPVAVADLGRMLMARSERVGARRALERVDHLDEAQRLEIRALLSEMLVSAVWEGWG